MKLRLIFYEAFLTLAGLLVILVPTSYATPVCWPENGHYYDAVPGGPDGFSWNEARTAAQNSVFMRYSGDLATITSPEENEFIVSNFPEAFYKGYWLGGFQPPGSEEPAGGWQWVTGEQWEFTKWALHEPNNENLFPGHPPEDSLCFRTYEPYGFGAWNDWYQDIKQPDIGYVVEYPVPEPAIICLLGLGGLGLLRRRRA